MSKQYKDYYWKERKPCGILRDSEAETEKDSIIHYKIVSDPYHKRISLEKYVQGDSITIAYDSALFDFRKLKIEEQNAWQKSMVSESSQKSICHIRDQDDRLILIEEYLFHQDLCRKCLSFSPHGILVSIQKIYYKSFGDPFDGAVLYDSNEHPVMYKKYQTDPTTKEFCDIIEEQWDMSLSASVLSVYSP